MITNEEIINEGWSEDMKKGRYSLQEIIITKDDYRDNWLLIFESIGDKQQMVFKGKCEDIETFRIINKLVVV